MNIQFFHFETIDSTNNFAKRSSELFDPTKLVVISADYQTEGRGRKKRKWFSNKGEDLLITFSLFSEERTNAGILGEILACTVCDCLEFFGASPSIKWPNDTECFGKKIAGILTETVIIRDQIQIILGLGLNIFCPLKTCEERSKEITSLVRELKHDIEIVKIKEKLIKDFKRNISVFFNDGFEIFFKKYKKYIKHKKGDLLQIHSLKEKIVGHFLKVSPKGGLVLQDISGVEFHCIAGEIL